MVAGAGSAKPREAEHAASSDDTGKPGHRGGDHVQEHGKQYTGDGRSRTTSSANHSLLRRNCKRSGKAGDNDSNKRAAVQPGEPAVQPDGPAFGANRAAGAKPAARSTGRTNRGKRGEDGYDEFYLFKHKP